MSLAAYKLNERKDAFLRVLSESRPVHCPFMATDLVWIINGRNVRRDIPIIPDHAIILDREHRTIVLTMRGTLKLAEVVADLMGDPTHVSSAELGCEAKAHTGMLDMAMVLCSDKYLPLSSRGWKRGKSREIQGPSVFVNREVWRQTMSAIYGESHDDGGSSSLLEVPVFPESDLCAPLFPPKVSGILAILQRLVDWSVLGLLDTDTTTTNNSSDHGSISSGDSPQERGTPYKGWRLVCTGHSLGAGVVAILTFFIVHRITFPGIPPPRSLSPEEQLGQCRTVRLIPSVPVHCIGLGSPASLSPSLASLGALTPSDAERFWRVSSEKSPPPPPPPCPRVVGTPSWWPMAPTAQWTPSLPLLVSCIIGRDSVCSMTKDTMKLLLRESTLPRNREAAREFTLTAQATKKVSAVLAPVILGAHSAIADAGAVISGAAHSAIADAGGIASKGVSGVLQGASAVADSVRGVAGRFWGSSSKSGGGASVSATKQTEPLFTGRNENDDLAGHVAASGDSGASGARAVMSEVEMARNDRYNETPKEGESEEEAGGKIGAAGEVGESWPLKTTEEGGESHLPRREKVDVDVIQAPQNTKPFSALVPLHPPETSANHRRKITTLWYNDEDLAAQAPSFSSYLSRWKATHTHGGSASGVESPQSQSQELEVTTEDITTPRNHHLPPLPSQKLVVPGTIFHLDRVSGEVWAARLSAAKHYAKITPHPRSYDDHMPTFASQVLSSLIMDHGEA